MSLEEKEHKPTGPPESLASQHQEEFEPVVMDFQVMDFSRNVFDILDKRFCSVLSGSLLFHALLIVFFLMNPLEDKMMLKVSEVQERLAKTLAEQNEFETPLAKFEFIEASPAEEDEVEAAAAAPAESQKSEAKPDVKKADTKIPKRPRRGRGGRSQAELASAVGSKGVLALLTSSSSSASGEAVADILSGTSQNRADLDKALSGLSGIRSSASTGTEGSGDVVGGRSGNAGSIDDVVAGLGEANTGSFERGGDFAVTSDSPLIENGESGIAGRNQDDIQSVILKHNKTVQYCYEKELKRNPQLRGKVVVRFTITPDGKVKNVELVSSDLNNRRVEHCIISKMRRWADFGSIDPSYGNTTIRQAYAFGY